MVGPGLVFRVEARLRNETWRKICVRKSWYLTKIVTYFGVDGTPNYYSEFNYKECVSADTVPNDTSINDIIVAELRPESTYREYNGIKLLRLENATDCSEVPGLIDLNVYCEGYGK